MPLLLFNDALKGGMMRTTLLGIPLMAPALAQFNYEGSYLRSPPAPEGAGAGALPPLSP